MGRFSRSRRVSKNSCKDRKIDWEISRVMLGLMRENGCDQSTWEHARSGV